MAGKPPSLRSEAWQSVDASANPAAYVAYLDRGAANLEWARREVVRSLNVTPGCSVLDVGSGAGEFLIEIAGSVDGVRAVGIDPSDVMVKAATQRARAAGVEVTFTRGDARHMEFPDGSFDRVHSSRTLQHIENPARAVAEMARVLAPGGLVAIIEPDHDAFIIDSEDLEVARAVRRQMTASVQNPDIGRRLRQLLLDRGLEIVALSGTSAPLTSLSGAIAAFRLYDYLDDAVSAGDVDEGRASRWRAWLEDADANGKVYIGGVLFRALATKPREY